MAFGINIDVDDIWQIGSDIGQQRPSGAAGGAECRGELDQGQLGTEGVLDLFRSHKWGDSLIYACVSGFKFATAAAMPNPIDRCEP